MKGKSKGKDSKGKNFGSSSGASASSSTLCWTCGKTGHFSSKCPLNRVTAVEEELYEEEVVDETGADFEAPWDDWSEWTVGALFDESWDSWDEGQVTRTLILGLGMVGGLKPPHRKLCRSLRRLRKNRLCSSPRLLKPPSRL